MGKIKSFINILKGKFIVLISTIHGKIIVIAVMGILSAGAVAGVVVGVSNNSSGSIVPNKKHKWSDLKPSKKTTPWSKLTPAKKPIPIPSKGKINLNSMSIFTKKQTYWDTGTQIGFIPTYYRYSLINNLTSGKTDKKTNNNTTLFSNGGVYYYESHPTHGYGNITTKTNFEYNKNNNILFNNLSVYSIIGWNPNNNWESQFDNTKTKTTDELKNINNKISPKINLLLSKLKQGQKLIISGINYYYDFVIVSHGNDLWDRDELNILINIDSLDYSIVNK